MSRAAWYAVAGAVLSLGEPIGLLIVRRLFGYHPIPTELLLERATYLYVFATTAVMLACLGYLIGRQADRLAALSETDSLTGLPNHRALRRRLADDLRRASRYEYPVSLLLLDVDGLKTINDQGGHAAGDRAIRHVAEAIADTLREADLGARCGGDEFAIVMPNTGRSAAQHSADRLMARLARSRETMRFPVTVSVGIATYDPIPGVRVGAEQLSKSADDALYSAKRAGRNRVHAA